MEHKETMDVYEFCEWLYRYLHEHDSEYVDKAVISEMLDKTNWIRLTRYGMRELRKFQKRKSKGCRYCMHRTKDGCEYPDGYCVDFNEYEEP